MDRNNINQSQQNAGQNKKILHWRKRTQALHQQQEEISTQRQDSSTISSAPRCMNTLQSPSRGTETSQQETCSLPNSENKSLNSSSFSLNPLAQEFQPSLSVFPPQHMMPVVGEQPQPVIMMFPIYPIPIYQRVEPVVVPPPQWYYDGMMPIDGMRCSTASPELTPAPKLATIEEESELGVDEERSYFLADDDDNRVDDDDEKQMEKEDAQQVDDDNDSVEVTPSPYHHVDDGNNNSRDLRTGKLLDGSSHVYNLCRLFSLQSSPLCQKWDLELDERVRCRSFEAVKWALDVVKPKLSDVSRHRLRTIVSSSELESLMKKARSILNKITPENFDRLVTRLSELVEEKVTCYEHLEVVLDAIVLVAVDQSAFVERYVELLSKMCQRKEMVESWEWVRAGRLDSEKIVKKIVTDLCRKRHEQYWYACNASRQSNFLSDFLDSPKEVSDLITQFCTNDVIESKMKNRFFGVGVLMGEMCKKKMVSKKLICCRVINPLLHLCPAGQEMPNEEWRGEFPSPEELEAVCKLLKIVGYWLDEAAKKWVNAYFDVLEDESAKLDKRAEFMVMDLKDLREDCWGRPQIVQRQRPVHRRDVSRGYRGRFSAHQDSYRRNSRSRYSGRY